MFHTKQVGKSKAELPVDDLQKKFPQIEGFHYVSSTHGTGIQELERDLINVTMKQSYMGENVPQVYLDLEKMIMRYEFDIYHPFVLYISSLISCL